MKGISIKNKLILNRQSRKDKENQVTKLGVNAISIVNAPKQLKNNNKSHSRRKSSCLQLCFRQRILKVREQTIEKNSLNPFPPLNNKRASVDLNTALIGKSEKNKNPNVFNFDEMKQIYQKYMKKVKEYLQQKNKLEQNVEIAQKIYNYCLQLIKDHNNIILKLKQTGLIKINEEETQQCDPNDSTIQKNSQKNMLRLLNQERIKKEQVVILQKLQIQALNIKIQYQYQSILNKQIRLRQLEHNKKKICDELFEIQQFLQLEQNRDLQQKLHQYKVKEQKLLKMITSEKEDTSKQIFTLLKDELFVSQSNFYMALKHFPSYKLESQHNYTLKGSQIEHFKKKMMLCYQNNFRKINQFYASKRQVFTQLAGLMIQNITCRDKIISNYFDSTKYCLTINK